MDNTATAFVRLTVADDDYEGCAFGWTAYAENADTDARQVRKGRTNVAILNNGLEPPGLRELAGELRVAPESLGDLLAHLEREARIVRAREDLWFDRDAVDSLRERVVAHLREHGRIETLAYKALIGTTRRTAIPLMELFDAERLTLRRGDVRVLVRAAG